jgi:mRNA-degrading endonuclease toxin of MazEF toxin-antitoxin module
MARRLSRGQIWLHVFKAPDKRRSVLIISRQALLDVLETATVVPITTVKHEVCRALMIASGCD